MGRRPLFRATSPLCLPACLGSFRKLVGSGKIKSPPKNSVGDADTWIIVLPEYALKRKLKTGSFLAFIAALLFLFVRPDYRQGEASVHGRPAKNFQFTVDGRPESLADLRGKVVVLNFWASWCQPCAEETPSLIQLQKNIAPRGGMILGVSIDDDQDAYADFVKNYHLDFPTYRDPTKSSASGFGTSMVPETYVIDRNGRIDRKIIGPQDWTTPEMTAYFNSVLAESHN